MSWLSRAKKGIKVVDEKREIPDNLWQKCPGCGDILYHRELERNFWVCAVSCSSERACNSGSKALILRTILSSDLT